jgi:hypothetical protein
VTTSEWKHLCSARFGEDRPSGSHSRWTGDHYRYDIFQSDGWLALRWSNGSGDGWLLAEDSTRHQETALLLSIAANPVEPHRWDACHFLWCVASETRRAATMLERARVFKAFADGRMKKHKNRKTGHSTVEVVPLAGEARQLPQSV